MKQTNKLKRAIILLKSIVNCEDSMQIEDIQKEIITFLDDLRIEDEIQEKREDESKESCREDYKDYEQEEVEIGY